MFTPPALLRVSLAICLAYLIVQTACNEPSAATGVEAAATEYQRLTAGAGNEEEIRAAKYELVSAYLAYCDAQPGDTTGTATRYLMAAAELLVESPEELEQAVGLYDRILTDYPESIEAGDALFMKAYVLHNELKELERAEQAYVTFLERYPNHDLASSARFELQNLGVPDAVILQNIMQANDSLRGDSLPME